MSWISPVSHNDPDSKWVDEVNAYDANQTTQAQDTQTGGTWGSYLELSFASEKTCSGGRFDAYFSGADVSSIHIQVNDATLGWTTVYLGGYADHVWDIFAFGAVYDFTTARVRFFSITTQPANFYEIDFWEPVIPVEPSSGLYVGNGASGKLFKLEDTTLIEKAPLLNGQTFINGMVLFNNALYGCTHGGGRLFQWNGVDAWTQVADEFGGQTRIIFIVVFDDKIYGGTATDGRLFEWNGANAWVEKAPALDSQTGIFSMAIFNDKLYGGTATGGRLFEWNGTDAWAEKAPALNSQTKIFSMAVFNGKLYGGTEPDGRLFEWNGTDAWAEKAPELNAQGQIYGLQVYNEKLYGVTGGGGRLFEWNGTDAWVEKAPQYSNEIYHNAVTIYNGKLTAGLYRVLQWNDSNAWEELAPQGSSNHTTSFLVVEEAGAGAVPAIFFGTNF